MFFSFDSGVGAPGVFVCFFDPGFWVPLLATGMAGNGYKLISIRCSLAANSINFALRGSVRRQVRSLAVRIQSGDIAHCGMKKRIVPLATTSQHNPPPTPDPNLLQFDPIEPPLNGRCRDHHTRDRDPVSRSV